MQLSCLCQQQYLLPRCKWNNVLVMFIALDLFHFWICSTTSFFVYGKALVSDPLLVPVDLCLYVCPSVWEPTCFPPHLLSDSGHLMDLCSVRCIMLTLLVQFNHMCLSVWESQRMILLVLTFISLSLSLCTHLSYLCWQNYIVSSINLVHIPANSNTPVALFTSYPPMFAVSGNKGRT